MPETAASRWGVSDKFDTINDVLRRAVRNFGPKQFVDILGHTRTFSEIGDAACRYANGLSALGVSKGHTVVTLLDTSVEAIELWLAILKLGAIAVPVNTAYKGEYLRHQVADTEAAVVIAESDYAERVCEVLGGLPNVTTLVTLGEANSLRTEGRRLLKLSDLKVKDNSDQSVSVTPGDLAMLIYTGGTTGPSKGCMNPHNYAINLARQIAECTDRFENAIAWTPLPFFHFNVYTATLLPALMYGGQTAITPRFSVSNFWPEIERTKANTITLIGSMIPLLVNAEESDAQKRCYGQITFAAGAPFPGPLQQAWKKRFGSKYTMAAGYGLTEASLVTTQPLEIPAPPDTSGLRNDDFDVRIIDDNGVEVSPGTPGEIIVRPLRRHVMFKGYWRRPAETLAVMTDLWFHTGDIGKFDEEGYFYFVDRKKDYLRRRGENISSFEVESQFRQHPAVADVAAHAVLSEFTEDELKVTVVLNPGATLKEEELCLWSVDRLPYFAVPRYVEFRETLPRNPVGRVLKYQLRDEGVTPTTWDREAAGIQIKKR